MRVSLKLEFCNSSKPIFCCIHSLLTEVLMSPDCSAEWFDDEWKMNLAKWLNLRYCPEIFRKEHGKPQEISIMIYSLRGKIWTLDLPDTTQGFYAFDNISYRFFFIRFFFAFPITFFYIRACIIMLFCFSHLCTLLFFQRMSKIRRFVTMVH
jgi:hypothetical protein